MSLDLDLLAKLRAMGVKHFRQDPGNYLDVEFFPQGPKHDATAVIPRSMTQDAPHQEEKCACGHLVDAHDSAGNCLLGGLDCPLEKCARSVAK